MPNPRFSALSALALLAVLAAPGARAGQALVREWTTGVAPVSWGFAIEPPVAAREVVLTARSPAVNILAARGGPNLPADWTVTVPDERRVVLAGATPLPAATVLSGLVVVETNRSSADISTRGAQPVQWTVRFVADPDARDETAETQVSFEPVLELSDAVSRGLVLATIEPLTPWGPAEVTVDNPTWQPLWLDLPPGSVVRMGGRDWVVGLVRPFRMLRKQKTGRTVDAFPLVPPGEDQALPRRLTYASRPGDQAALVAATGLAVKGLRERAITSSNLPGRYEALRPFDFWSLVLRWAVWQETGGPSRDLLLVLVDRTLAPLQAAGDPLAVSLDAEGAAGEVEAAVAAVATARAALENGILPLPLEASRARFH